MKSILLGCNKATMKRNPHLFPVGELGDKSEEVGFTRPSEGKRVRQPDKPMNKLEANFAEYLWSTLPPSATYRAQAKRYRLANGAWYRPDFTANVNGVETAWECKGPKAVRWSRRGELTIKFAAAAWPEVRWILVWQENNQWQQQEIKP